MSQELYKRLRPTTLKQIIGQEAAVATLAPLLKDPKQVPHALLFTGPSGCGKTTLARIVCRKIGSRGLDLNEINAADFRGVDTIRDIRRNCQRRPIHKGGNTAYIVDECQQLTKEAMSAFLKLLEDTPDRVYFLLCTTDPDKLLKTILTRCTQIVVGLLDENAIKELIRDICERGQITISGAVIEKIVEVADGSARKVVVLLDQIRRIKNEEEQIECLDKADATVQAVEICRALFRRASWSEITKLLKNVDEEPNKIRIRILTYADAVLLSNPKQAPRASFLIETFRDLCYTKAELDSCCYAVCMNKS